MHISDGVLSAPVWVGSFVVSSAIIAGTVRKMKAEDTPRVAIMTSVFFVASLVHFPIGPTSVHLILNGLMGIMLGPLAFVSVFLGLFFQTLLFQHGGITSIGANTLMIGLPALLAGRLFMLNRRFSFRLSVPIFGAIAGGMGILLSLVVLSVFLITTGEEFVGVAKLAVLGHLPVIIVEALLTGFITSFLMVVKPELLGRRR